MTHQTMIESLGRFQLSAWTSRNADNLFERMTCPMAVHSLSSCWETSKKEAGLGIPIWEQNLLVCFCDVATGDST